MTDILDQIYKEHAAFQKVYKYVIENENVTMEEMHKKFDIPYELLIRAMKMVRLRHPELQPLKDECIIIDTVLGWERIVKSWKDYPLDQFLREETLGRVIQSHFIPPKCQKCGGEFHKILICFGLFYLCDGCGAKFPVVSHRVFFTNDEEFITQQI